MGYGHYGRLTFGFHAVIRHLSEDEVSSAIDQFGSAELSVNSLWSEWDQDVGYVVYVVHVSHVLAYVSRGLANPNAHNLFCRHRHLHTVDLLHQLQRLPFQRRFWWLLKAFWSVLGAAS